MVQIYKLADKEFLITVCSKNKGKDGKIYEKKNSIQSLESIKNQMDTWPNIGNINRMWQKWSFVCFKHILEEHWLFYPLSVRTLILGSPVRSWAPLLDRLCGEERPWDFRYRKRGPVISETQLSLWTTPVAIWLQLHARPRVRPAEELPSGASQSTEQWEKRDWCFSHYILG